MNRKVSRRPRLWKIVDGSKSRKDADRRMIEDARELFVKYRGRAGKDLVAEMRARGWTKFSACRLMGRQFRNDGHGWILRFGWLDLLEPKDRDARLRDREQRRFISWLNVADRAHHWEWRHQRPIHRALQRIVDGKSRRLMIFLPPRHGKSELVTIRFSAWMLLKRPGSSIVIACYNQYLANKFSRSIRRVYKDWLARFSTQVRAKRPLINTVAEWETHDDGGVKAVGVGSGITGFGADLIIIDDPIKSRAEAESENNRNAIWEWFNDDLRTRLEGDKPIILIQTRWHEDDLAGRLLKEAENGGEQWDVVSLPALAEDSFPAETQRREEEHEGGRDPLGRKAGDALWPEKFPAEHLMELKRQMGTYSFEALYQQRPVPLDGSLFKRHWFKGKVVDNVPKGLAWVRGYDLAVSTKTSADYTASFRCAQDGQGNLYIADGYRARVEFPDQRRYIIDRIRQEADTDHCIESALHGQAFVQELMREERLISRTFRAVRVEGDKFTRALPWASRAEAGKVFLVRGPWIDEFLAELCAFPTGKHDDQVDAVSLAVSRLSRPKRNFWTF